MSQSVYRIEAYWRPRQETTHDCAVRLGRMLEGLANAHPAFAQWNKKANTRAAANRPAWQMPPKIAELTQVFERGRQYKDVPRDPWPEMGYSISAWNGRNRPHGASLSVWAGVYADWIPFPNTVDLRLNPTTLGNNDLVNAGVLKPALLSVATAWEPDYATVASSDYWEHLFTDGEYASLRSGWLTYLAPRYAGLIKPPSAAIIEPVSGGGMLLLATEEQFSMDNPKHVAVADSIQRALEPLQKMVPPGRDDHLRRERSR